jgi:hypothetical protein
MSLLIFMAAACAVLVIVSWIAFTLAEFRRL